MASIPRSQSKIDARHTEMSETKGTSLTDKIQNLDIWGKMFDTAVTFQTQRMVYTNNKRIGVIYRTLQLGMLFYVIWSTITGSLYLKVYDAQGLITGWLEPGYMTNSTILINGRAQQYYPTTCTGTGQQSRCTIGQPQAADIVNPPYCGTPYTDDYVQNVHFDYGRVKCARFGEYDVGLKRTPTYFFVSTCIHDREYILDKCDVAGSTCNTTSTNFLGKVGESCQCRNVNNYYPINPEGIMVYLKHEFNSHAMSGNSRVRGTVPEVTTYLRRKGSTDNLYTFNAGSNIELSVGQLLRTANVNLDDYAPLDQVTPSTTDFGAAGGNMPFNRMTGVCLLLDMEYMNFNVDKDSDSGIAIDDWDKKVSCIVTISRIGSWCSMGSEAAADKSTTFTQVSGKVYAQKSKVLDRYRQGIKIIFRQHGSIGDLDPFKIVDAFIQGVVLLGVATNLTTLIANNTIPGLDWMLGLEDFAAIFSRYYATPVDAQFALKRTAAHAAAKCAEFFRAFDPGMTGELDQTRLYEMLKVMLSADLNDEQIAELVNDICGLADIDGDGSVNVDEFVQFLSDDSCDLMNVITSYKKREGNLDALKKETQF